MQYSARDKCGKETESSEGIGGGADVSGREYFWLFDVPEDRGRKG